MRLCVETRVSTTYKDKSWKYNHVDTLKNIESDEKFSINKINVSLVHIINKYTT